ncbi:unnamed protein product [Durusdinium trenchii]|uniref:RING-type E3 ubiquitin transferase n=1 Tax=Durusdinium trenchii TaxID=1381693 RepID=A0ABP0IL22_9DINO
MRCLTLLCTLLQEAPEHDQRKTCCRGCLMLIHVPGYQCTSRYLRPRAPVVDQCTLRGSEDYSRILEQGRQARAQVRAPHLRASEWLPKEGSSAECAICLANLEVGALVSSLPCSHLFHFECIARWMLQGASMRCSGSCPLCRQQVEESSA